MAKFRYFLPLRPVSLGTQPNGFTEYKNFEKRQHCPEIDREAWGWVEYEKPLTDKQVEEYELIPVVTNRFKLIRMKIGTREEASKILGIPARSLECYEQGRRDPKRMATESFKRMADALGMSMEELYNDL